MLPIFAGGDNLISLKPMLQEIFERLFEYDVREFYFVVGRGKRAIEDHFTPDWGFISRLNAQGKDIHAIQLEKFYRKIEASTIAWINQHNPRGFGDAVLQARSLVGGTPFFVHAGDTCISSPRSNVYEMLSEAYALEGTVAAVSLKEVSDARHYGVADVVEDGTALRVTSLVEKPEHPTTNLAIMPIYIFGESIFDAIVSMPPGKGGEIQLTDGIQKLIHDGNRVTALRLTKEDVRLDIGTPETYWEALQISYKEAVKDLSLTQA